MAPRPKKPAGPFVLWHELMRDDAYQLRNAFNPDRAEYVARVNDDLDLSVAPTDTDALPDLTDAVVPRSSERSPRQKLFLVLGGTLVLTGIAISFFVLNQRPEEMPTEPDTTQIAPVPGEPQPTSGSAPVIPGPAPTSEATSPVTLSGIADNDATHTVPAALPETSNTTATPLP